MKKSPNPTDQHVGKRLRMRRLMLDLSQTDLGDALGVSFQQVQKYEKGTNRISASRLQKISTVLQVPVPFFFEGLPDTSDAPLSATVSAVTSVFDFLATSDGLALAKSFVRIKQLKLRRGIVQLVEAIATYRG